MKLLNARFENFRLLRDLKLDFATGADKNLTVIRAANESGKTTILHALQWALYGDLALPGGKGGTFRLFPIDWDTRNGTSVPITATVEFELTSHHRVDGELRATERRYRLVRSAFEQVSDKWRPVSSTVKLFELSEIGTSPINAPETFVKEKLPPELREVFFTDSDRALSFIEADIALSAKRKRVQSAIRSLLGIGVIDDAIKHVRKSEAEINRKVKEMGTDSELDEVVSRLDSIEKIRNELEEDLKDAEEQFGAYEGRISKIEKDISLALEKGDKEKLRKELEDTKRNMERLDKQIASAKKEHSDLFRSRSIAFGLLSPALVNAFDELEKLHDQGKIPSNTVPVLQDRLDAGLCICGETLQPGDPEDEKRRTHIHNLIKDSEKADEIQKIVTELYYGSKSYGAEGPGSTVWLEEYKEVVERREDSTKHRGELGRKYRGLEDELKEIPDINIQGLRSTQNQYKGQRDNYHAKMAKIDTQLEGLRSEQKSLSDKRERLLREQKKGARVLSELRVVQDIVRILQSSYERITNEELQKVSNLMNQIFLEMIGADHEQGAIIQRAEISQEFDIIVYGTNERMLDPDRDLNGASRRALTLAFILALTKVSEVEAPNVIDTPLGMTSGYVKRSILRAAIQESAQLILFLTHDEIIGCEAIIDEAAGVVVTLTNPAHYPKMLVNDPGIEERKILSCECDHRSECQLCQRRSDAHVEQEMAV